LCNRGCCIQQLPRASTLHQRHARCHASCPFCRAPATCLWIEPASLMIPPAIGWVRLRTPPAPYPCVPPPVSGIILSTIPPPITHTQSHPTHPGCLLACCMCSSLLAVWMWRCCMTPPGGKPAPGNSQQPRQLEWRRCGTDAHTPRHWVGSMLCMTAINNSSNSWCWMRSMPRAQCRRDATCACQSSAGS
jgi:hypothetical protein